MKKGGYDFSVAIVKILATYFMQLLVMIFNHLFYVKYPHSYTYSLLFAIEKIDKRRKVIFLTLATIEEVR